MSSLASSSSSSSSCSSSSSVQDVSSNIESLDETESSTPTTTSSASASAPASAKSLGDEVASLESFVNDTRPVFVVSSSGERFQLTRKEASISMLLRTTLMNDGDATDVIIPDEASALVMNRVVAYLRHHNGTIHSLKTFVNKPLTSIQIRHNCADIWSAEFIDHAAEDKRDTVFQLALTANYMDIPCLLYLAVARSVCMIKGEPEENIAKNSIPNEPCFKHRALYAKQTHAVDSFIAQPM